MVFCVIPIWYQRWHNTPHVSIALKNQTTDAWAVPRPNELGDPNEAENEAENESVCRYGSPDA